MKNLDARSISRALLALMAAVGPRPYGFARFAPRRARRCGAILRANPTVYVTRPAGHVPSGDPRCAFA